MPQRSSRTESGFLKQGDQGPVGLSFPLRAICFLWGVHEEVEWSSIKCQAFNFRLSHKSYFMRQSLEMSHKLCFMGHMNDPLCEHELFPYFYYNSVEIQGIESNLKRDIKSLKSTVESPEIWIAELHSNYSIEGKETSLPDLEKSYQRNMERSPDNGKATEAKAVQALKLIVDNYDKPLTHELVKKLNTLVIPDDNSGEYVGDMTIVVEKHLGDSRIIDRGSKSSAVEQDMDDFISLFNQGDKKTPFYNAVRSHVHFEKIHPFPDGNGRVGRLLFNMSLMRDLELDTPLAISRGVILNREIYSSIFKENTLDLTETCKNLTALIKDTITETERIIEITLLRKHAFSQDLNDRQTKVFNRLCMYELHRGFEGKFTNTKYRKMAKLDENRKTAARDLQDLCDKGVLVQSGQRKATQYFLALKSNTKD